jgi:hypothetical protein
VPSDRARAASAPVSVAAALAGRIGDLMGLIGRSEHTDSGRGQGDLERS